MKPKTHQANVARRALATSLAALMAAPFAFGQAGDAAALRRLQEENAALRRQLAEAQAARGVTPATTAPAARPAATPTGPAAPRPATSSLSTDEGVQVLSPFQVNSEKDYGYLKTNSATATRIGTEIQKVPLSISVISEEFLKDLNFSDIQDVLRYQSSSAGDTRMGILQPGNGFTPSGNLSLRGFPINSRLRNGLLRFNQYSLDNVERVEVIKGPAAIFFGQAFPGGVINYVTKQPQFAKLPTSITYSYGGNTERMGSERATLDQNYMLSDKAAFRVVGQWEKAQGDRKFEFQDGVSFTPSFTFVPFKSGKLRINVESEYNRRTRNQDDTSWFWPQGWFDAYRTPPSNLIAIAGLTNNANPAAAYRARINNNIGQWIADVRNAANDQYIPLWTEKLRHGAFYTNRTGQRVYDPSFNYYGQGSYSDEENVTTAIVTEASPFPWVDIRHSYTTDDSRYTENKSSASPYADGINFNTTGGILKRDYIIDAQTHQLDLVFKQKIAGIENKLLVGGIFRETWSTFTGTNAANLTGTGQFPFFGNLPGSFDKPNEGYVSPIPAQFRSTTFAGNFSQQFVRDRNGRILTPVEIFTLYDPAVHPNPDIRRITEVSRGLVDHGNPQRKEWYVNWQGSALNNRLIGFLGYRVERALSNGGQRVDGNYPWYTVSANALEYLPQSEWASFGVSDPFSRAVDRKGNARMGGVSFEVTKNVNIYASYSQTFLTNGPLTLGGDTDLAAIRARAVLLGLNPDTTVANYTAAGGLTRIKNEKGKNSEIGVKVSLFDNKIVGTASIFRVQRGNRALDDLQRQADEPLNYLLPNRAGPQNRVIRWYSNDAQQQTEGFEFDAVWTPMRNLQAIVSGSWMWQAETVADPSIAATNIARPIIFGNRLPFAPKYRFNFFPKYTFTEGVLGGWGRGASTGFGFRYASQIIISNDQNFNASRGGLTAGNYTVFDAVFGYPVEVYGYRMNLTLNINNVFNKDYSEGGLNLSPPRTWTLTTGFKF